MRCPAFLIPLLALSALLLVGCQSRPGYTVRDVAPLYDNFGHARSLALSTPGVIEATRHNTPYEPWYVGRRDVGPFVTTGHHGQTQEHSVTYTTDRQYILNGRVFDRYYETTERRTYRDSVR